MQKKMYPLHPNISTPIIIVIVIVIIIVVIIMSASFSPLAGCGRKEGQGRTCELLRHRRTCGYG